MKDTNKCLATNS